MITLNIEAKRQGLKEQWEKLRVRRPKKAKRDARI